MVIIFKNETNHLFNRKILWYCFCMNNPNLNSSKTDRIEPALASGFRDFAPLQAIEKNRILDIVRSKFELFGFDPIYTPAVERTEVLLGGEEEFSKEIFKVSRLAADKESDTDKISLSLRFDLTVPLARFICANPDTPKPFRRYQIGQVWRGERPQAGRYREFTQADADIVGSNSYESDAEIIILMYEVMKDIGLEDFVIKVNSRGIANALPKYAGFDNQKLPLVLRIIDKIDKIGIREVEKELVKQAGKGPTSRILKLIQDKRGRIDQQLKYALNIFDTDDEAYRSIEELSNIIRTVALWGIKERYLDVDFSVVRGLGYYTGTVFETVVKQKDKLGSVFSGGRYDKLTFSFSGRKIPAVGTSLGVDRLLAIMNSDEIRNLPSTTSQVIIFNLEQKLYKDYFEFLKQLRRGGINTFLYTGSDMSFQAQLSYALKKGIPVGVIFGSKEKEAGIVEVKDFRTKKQESVSRNKLVDFVVSLNKENRRS